MKSLSFNLKFILKANKNPETRLLSFAQVSCALKYNETEI